MVGTAPGTRFIFHDPGAEYIVSLIPPTGKVCSGLVYAVERSPSRVYAQKGSSGLTYL